MERMNCHVMVPMDGALLLKLKRATGDQVSFFRHGELLSPEATAFLEKLLRERLS